MKRKFHFHCFSYYKKKGKHHPLQFRLGYTRRYRTMEAAFQLQFFAI